MKTFKKVCRVGTLDMGTKNRASLFIKIENDRGYLSISGVIGPNNRGGCRGSCGQICMGFAHRDPKDNDERYNNPIKPQDIAFAPEWGESLWLDLLDTWKVHHLKEKVPNKVLNFLESLPDADQSPAWC